MIDAREVVAIINMFNIEKYDAQTHPMQAYSSKAKMLELYLQDPEFYRKFVNVMPDIFDLYDQIEMEFADAYNSAGGRYGRKKYSGHKDDSTVGKSKFGMHDLKYKIPDGFMYPVVAHSALICSIMRRPINTSGETASDRRISGMTVKKS